MSRTVIAGGSVAAVRTAQSLRAAGYDGEIVLLGQEDDPPYDKPPLSKGILLGSASADSIRLLRPDDADRAGMELLLGHRAVAVDVAARLLRIDGASPLRYDTLVVATGAHARPSPWGERRGLHVLRTLRDAQRLRDDLRAGGHLVVVGSGFIGAEVASSARALGVEVTMIDPVSSPMSRVVSVEIGNRIAALHHAHGVQCRFGVGVEAVDGDDQDFRVLLTDGSQLLASTIVVGIGAEPNDAWLRSSGLLVDDGLVCDQHCRAIGAQDVFGVGDVARWWHPRTRSRVRLEHWTNAVEQAAVVAHNITRPDAPRAYAPTAYVWSDQHDWRIQVVGHTGGLDAAMVLEDPGHDRFAAVYSTNGATLSGAVVVNWPRALAMCRKAIHGMAPLRDVLKNIEALATPDGEHPFVPSS